MSETKKTIIFGGVAVLLALLAIVTAPSKVTPNAFLDQGEPFFPNFEDPNRAASLEVINFDEETGEPVPFKVVFEEGRWTIPSHHNYPADGKDRLAKTAAAVINLKKDDFRSDNVADHEACGVIDPLDETATSLEGRGKRVTIKGKNGNVLADIIIGDKIEGREGFRFVRIPEQKRVYAAKADIEISTKFSDWIDADLMQVEKDAITQVTLKDYSINERTGSVNQRDVVRLTQNGSDWSMNRMPPGKEVDKTKVDQLVKNLDELKIVGVRPKPEGLSANLKTEEGSIQVSQQDMLSLQSKGFYFSRDGSLLSNEGELDARTKDGLTYTLRFGEVAYGSGFDVSAGTDNEEKQQKGPAENRYLFITTKFNPELFEEPPEPNNTNFQDKPDTLWTDADRRNKELFDKHEAWKEKIEKGKQTSQELNERFANWYYVISSESFEKLHLKRDDLLRDKKQAS